MKGEPIQEMGSGAQKGFCHYFQASEVMGWVTLVLVLMNSKFHRRDTTDYQWNEGERKLTQSWGLCRQADPLTLWRTAMDKYSSLCDNPESQAKNSSVTKVCYPIFYFYTWNQIWIMALLLSINVWRHGRNSGSSFLLELWFNSWLSLKVDTSPSWEACSLNMSNQARLLVGDVAVEAGNGSWH